MFPNRNNPYATLKDSGAVKEVIALLVLIRKGFDPFNFCLGCLIRLDSCYIELLSLGEWIEKWDFVLLEVCTVIVAVFWGIKPIKHLTRTGN